MTHPSQNFFQSYKRIILATFSLVTVVSSSLFYIPFRSRYQDEIEQLKIKFLQAATSLDDLVKGASDHVNALQVEAETYLIANPQSQFSLLFSQPGNTSQQNYYTLDRVKSPFTETTVGNLSGIYPWISSKDFLFADNLYEQDFYRLRLPEINPDEKCSGQKLTPIPS